LLEDLQHSFPSIQEFLGGYVTFHEGAPFTSTALAKRQRVSSHHALQFTPPYRIRRIGEVEAVCRVFRL
jgi:hypothetical protein